MNKVGIVTLYKNNFGSILQAYSSYSYIQKLGNECVILEFYNKPTLKYKVQKLFLVLYKSLRFKGFFRDKLESKKRINKELGLLSEKTRGLMDDFVNQNFVIEYYDMNAKDELNDRFSYFVTGSDQVWNGYSDVAFLRFAEKSKRIALAPSFGGNKIKKYYEKEVKRGLLGFDRISTREESGAKIIYDLTGKKAERIADPTIIYNKTEWEEFSQKGINVKGHILCHFLNKPNDLAISMIKEYLHDSSCEIVCIANDYEEYKTLNNYTFLEASPYDYVSLISNSEYIFTDSFHTTLFSLNLEKNFLTFERQYSHNLSQESRILNLLTRVGATERYVRKWISIGDLPDVTRNAFEEERNSIKEYIKENLMK